MAYENDQNDFPLPAGKSVKRTSVQHLPKYFRTEPNKKFLGSTLDQMIQPGVVEKLNGYYGRKTAKSYAQGDNYIGDVSAKRENYQLEPASIIQDTLGNVSYYKDYNDFVNQIGNLNGVNTDHSRLNEQEQYAWQPHINWDKFTNFREYYWLPNGPQTVSVKGQNTEVESTYTVSLVDNGDNVAFLFSPDGKTQNPSLKLYRGITYTFNISTPGLPFSIRTKRTLDDGFNLNSGISAQSIEDGTITLTCTSETPNELYYIADNDINNAGLIKVANIEEATSIDVETEILGKANYTTSDGFALSNGMKIKFIGEVTPSAYAVGEYYVEGVGDEIKLIDSGDLNISSSFASDLVVQFDAQEFDRLPFDRALGYPAVKDYIVINRASADGNLWTRYNRWFHKDVVVQSAELNGQIPDTDESARAKRPIIEFDAGLKLYQFGTKTKQDVDLVDDFTTDVFSNVEGAQGYNIDNVEITEGMRILFTADPDPFVNGKIYKVDFINFNDGTGRANTRQIALREETDTDPLENEVVLVKQGNQNKGTMYYYTGTAWKKCQLKNNVNQTPLFDIFDSAGKSYADDTSYSSTTFKGNKVFSYKVGTGSNDKELGFPIAYRSIDNVGDITFTFDLLNQTFDYQIDNELYTKSTDIGFLRKYDDRTVYKNVNGWQKTDENQKQNVIRQYVFDNTTLDFDIDVYDNSNDIDDMWLRVYKNNKLQFLSTDYTVNNGTNGNKYVRFVTTPTEGDIIIIKTRSATVKNENGFYEIPGNLERNPLNNNLVDFTLGEVNDHVGTIVEEVEGFTGIYPGSSNLRDISNLSTYGRRFVKHSSPFNLASYLFLEKNSNVVLALKYARKEYGKFKRLFLQTANELGFDGPIKDHCDNVLAQMHRDKTDRMPFYFTDMVPVGASKKNDYPITDEQQTFFALEQVFNLDTASDKAVGVYLNGNQLVHGKDYTFNDEGFIVLKAGQQTGDTLTVYEYESTNGSFVPATPTKLGLYPAYEPKMYNDNTYQTTQKVIQGHDGSIFIAYNDFRDELLLELEKRIYNNLKQTYDPKVFDINDYVGGTHRKTKFTRDEVNQPMLPDFVEWLELTDDDYTEHNFFDRTNSFTFNYSSMGDPNNKPIPGFWRQVYKEAFDTDRPHTHPWEMLGFTIEPTWWQDVYGPAPYTSDNLVMWQDLENGYIKEPGKQIIRSKKYKRPGLTAHIPVNENGQLISPNDSGYVTGFNSAFLKESFVFGDGSPVESAWRKSSEYAFSILTSYLINQPHKVLSAGFDTSRQNKNIIDQIVYGNTEKPLHLSKIVFPNTFADAEQVFTSGLINYVADYMASNVTSSFEEFKNNLVSIKNQIGVKIAGYTEKQKFRLILDSRTPLNEGNVFVPDENYKIILNKSTPVEIINYSGVIVEKRSDGYIVRGYDNTSAKFITFPVVQLDNDPSINIGGISEPFLSWDEGKVYVQGQNIEFAGAYYRVKEQFTSGSSFDDEKLAKLPRLPLIGGRDAVIRKTFDKRKTVDVPYGTQYRTIQEVVDFLLGYGAYLESKGFEFNYFDDNTGVVTNWESSAKEFLFWTLQNWSAGSVITLSPAGFEITYNSEYSVVDNVFDTLYGYSLLKSDGKKLQQEFSASGRNDNRFTLRPKATADGIFAVKLPLVQKEHVVLLDNKTVFGDTIYDPEPGYRQERIKVLGYRTTDWNGTFNIPGFIYDDAKTTEWKPWTDYAIGDTVKYKEFYYSANEKIPGEEIFDSNKWSILSDKPSSKLVPNFEYKTNQFADFYDLDTDNFDSEQQKLAQHLIGYQKRKYLENIINDDVSQYKFYQGYIQEKGTRNSLTKLFDVLGSADKDSLEFFEEWAVRSGQYGASAGYDEVDYILDESQFKLTPQPIELVNRVSGQETDLIYRIRPFEVYSKPKDYNHRPFPTKYISNGYTKDSGYVDNEDIQFVVQDYDEILNLTFRDVGKDDNIWVGNDKLTWNVYRHIETDIPITNIIGGDTTFDIVLDSTPNDFKAGDIIGLYDIKDETINPDDSTYEALLETSLVSGKFYKVKDVQLNVMTVETSETVESVDNAVGKLTRLTSVRTSDLKSLNKLAETLAKNNSIFWVDSATNNKWEVLQSQDAYSKLQDVSTSSSDMTTMYASAMAVNASNTVIAVGAPDDGDGGKVYIYRRGSSSRNWLFSQVLEADENLATNQKFGSSLSLSPDGKYLLIGSPGATGVKSKYEGAYVESTDYTTDDIVSYQNNLWIALDDIEGSEPSIQFSSFDSTEQILLALGTNADPARTYSQLTIGNAPINNVSTDHLLIRAPKDMYEGTKVGDRVVFKWNSFSAAWVADTDYTTIPNSPFGAAYDPIDVFDGNLLGSPLAIAKKVDVSLYVNSFTSAPQTGDRVETATAFGTVNYVFEDNGQLVIYLENVNGTFAAADSLFLANGEFVGEFERTLPEANLSSDHETYLGGYWKFDFTPNVTTQNTANRMFDEGNGLVIYDVLTEGEANSDRYYYNILDYRSSANSSENTKASYIRTLSFEGFPGPGNVSGEFLSDKYVIRAPKPLTDTLSPGDTFDFYVPPTTRDDGSQPNDPSDTALSFADFNRELTVYALWDGYINFLYTKFDGNGDPFEPRVGDIVEDVTTGATAEVTFYQRDGLVATVFVTNVTGNWSLGDDYGDNAEIKFQATPADPDPIYQVERVMGQTQFISLGLDSANIGKLIVIDNGADLAIDTTDKLEGIEYWFFNENTINGIPRPANIPSVDNNDWRLTYKVPAVTDGTQSSYTAEGMYSIYELKGSKTFDLVSAFTHPNSENSFALGSQSSVTKYNDLYRFVIGANNQLYFVKKGTDSRNATWDFEYAKDKKYKGTFSASTDYKTDDLVYLDGFTYRAKTNISAGVFNTNDWNVVTDQFDYLGYIPNDTLVIPSFDSTDGSTLDIQGLSEFGTVYDISKNGEVLVVLVKYTDDRNKVLVYRSNKEKFQLYQQIEAVNETQEFGYDIALSDDAELLAISAPYDDTADKDQGLVYIYDLQNGNYVLSQTLNSRNNEKVELFGTTIDFTANGLVVTGRNADGKLNTTFDKGVTNFDNKFTTFGITYEDSGVVYLYDRIHDTMVYSSYIDYEKEGIRQFGKYVIANRDHVYVGMPNLSVETNKLGAFIDYRKDDEKELWKTLRSPIDTVDLDKIKRIALYNTKTNELLQYIDYIDPVQGKIAGPAEQELRYKLYYDPAYYTTGTSIVNVDAGNAWQEAQVGQLWWDLTNAKFLNVYQGNIIFQANNWNSLFGDNSIEIYEWVSSKYLPSEWDALTDTEEGFSEGVSGTSKYGDSVYSTRRIYDPIAKTFTNKYYYWVKDKKTIPVNEFRSLSAFDVGRLIADPKGQNYRHLNLLTDSRFVLHNCDSLIKGKDVALSVQYWTIPNQEINIHNQYQIITEGLETSKPNRDIERKWFDSLIGKDDKGRPVPSLELGPKEKYGILNNPRQSWFINNTEAFKQVITRVNSVLKDNLIVDNKNIQPLMQADPEPSANTNVYDTKVDVVADLEFVGVAKAKQAKLTPVINDVGTITRIIITDPGRGYLVPPTLTFIGQGSGAQIELTLTNTGGIETATVVDGGKNYTTDTLIDVRKFTVLVENDESIQGKWALYERNTETRQWARSVSQAYDTRLMWDYVDWYADGYSKLNEIKYVVDQSYELQGLGDSVGDLVKIKSIGGSGWLLLEKIDSGTSVDYTQNYKTVGRENGTIQFSSKLYDTTQSLTGFDSVSFDTKFFDSAPTTESRIILETIRDHLLVNDLELEYNKLFFASLRYVFSEQPYVDWAFKTSFIKARHNTGELEQKINFQNDSLQSYEEYLREVKPYKSQLREYLSDYEVLDNTRSLSTDFDLAPYYDELSDSIKPVDAKIVNSQLIGSDDVLETYPNKNWKDNFGFKVTNINIGVAGSKYEFPPSIEITGGGGSGATAVAYLGKDGDITEVKVTNKGSGYLSQPTVTVNGSVAEGGTRAVLAAKLGDSPVRNLHTVVKFDRMSGTLRYLNLNETENFVGNGNRYIYKLKYPMDLRLSTIEVNVNNVLSLSSEYTFRNVKDTTKGYDRYFGEIIFTTPPSTGHSIVVSYKKPIEFLEVQDRINLFYKPEEGQFDNDLAQLMDGIDYGGVEVKSFDFGGLSGWDSQPWYTDAYDTYDTTYEDEVFTLDGSTISLDLAKPLENGVSYNVYRNGIRLDDPNYPSNPANEQAIMTTIVGDGTTQVLELQENNVPTSADDVIVLRKATSDGSFVPESDNFDVSYDGGNFAYTTASGVKAEDILVDGDAFVTPTTSKGPEELVPGQVLDTVDLKVYERPKEGSSNIITRNFIGDGSTTTFGIDKSPFKNENVFVKIGSVIQNTNTYTINYDTNSIVFNTAPSAGDRINVTIFGITGTDILDIESFVSDGSTSNIITNVQWDPNVNFIVTSNGVEVPTVALESRAVDGEPGNVLLALSEAVQAGDVVNYAIFLGENITDKNFSQVVVDTITADGSTLGYPLAQHPFYNEPAAFNIIVQVGNRILNAGYSETFTVSSTREYQLDLSQVPVTTFGNQNIEVFLNNRKLTFLDEWTFIGGGIFDESTALDQQIGSTVVLRDGIGEAGDELVVHIISNGEYRFGYYETDADSTNSWNATPGVIYFDETFAEGTEIKVYQFSNHDAQKIKRTTYQVAERTELTAGTEEWIFLRQMRNGLIKLDKEAYDSQYVWVSINNNLLTPNMDYTVTPNKQYIKIINPIVEDDKVQIIHFSAPPVVNKFGWRQFKDMLNRTHYKRLDESQQTKLAQTLNYYDRTIVLEDASALAAPSDDARTPGIIFIDKERIEYWKKDGNTLKQLRRGTLGTGVKSVHAVGSEVIGQANDQTMPYRDETITNIFTADGTTNVYTLDFNVDNENLYALQGTQAKSDIFEVFVGGKRLRKEALQSFQLDTDLRTAYASDDEELAQDSPEGDITLPAEFTVSGSTLTLLDAPSENVKVIVIRKQGRLWSDPGTPLGEVENDIGNFLRAKTVDLPR